MILPGGLGRHLLRRRPQSAPLTIFAPLTRAREAGRRDLGGAMPTDLLDLLGPPGWCSGARIEKV
jgi:hypothetical protein